MAVIVIRVSNTAMVIPMVPKLTNQGWGKMPKKDMARLAETICTKYLSHAGI